MGGHSFAALMGAAVLALVTVGCGSDNPEEKAETADPPAQAPVTGGSLVVASGEEGFAIGRGADLRPIGELTADAAPFAYDGPIAVPFDEDSVAIDGGGEIAIASADGEAAVAHCTDCAGIAVVGREVITTRKNFEPGEGFDIVRYGEDLAERESVAARRLSERVALDLGENTASPVTLAANADRVTVGYLSAEGGVRGGPSIIAQYGYDGELLDSARVRGIIGRSAVSPDGRHVAVGLGGSGGACSTMSELAVVALEGLEVLDTKPAVPAEVLAGFDDLDEPWFWITDLVWDGDTVITIGEVYRTGWAENPDGSQAQDCEVPEIWTRTYDTATGEFTDVPGADVRARRRIGSSCDEVIEVRGPPFDGPTLIAVVDGQEEQLGSYRTLSLGQPAPPGC